MSELQELKVPILGTDTLSPDTKRVWWEDNGMYRLFDSPSLFPEADKPKGVPLSWPHVKPEEAADNPTGWYRAEIAETYGGYTLKFSKPPQEVALTGWWKKIAEERERLELIRDFENPWLPRSYMGLADLVNGPSHYQIGVDPAFGRDQSVREAEVAAYTSILASAFGVSAYPSPPFINGLGSFLASCLPSRRVGGVPTIRIVRNDIPPWVGASIQWVNLDDQPR